MAVLALGFAAPLALAGWLTPSPAGRGTHEQLGLPPCTILVLWGRPCPTCGMTTSWANVVRARFGDAWRANAGGTLLCPLDALAVAWLLLSAASGRWLGGTWPGRLATASGVAIFCVALIDWALRLAAWNA